MRRRLRVRHTVTEFIRLNTSLCRACWTCVEACPNSVIGKIDLTFHRHAHIVHSEQCQGCGRCVKSCPQKALALLK